MRWPKNGIPPEMRVLKVPCVHTWQWICHGVCPQRNPGGVPEYEASRKQVEMPVHNLGVCLGLRAEVSIKDFACKCMMNMEPQRHSPRGDFKVFGIPGQEKDLCVVILIYLFFVWGGGGREPKTRHTQLWPSCLGHPRPPPHHTQGWSRA